MIDGANSITVMKIGGKKWGKLLDEGKILTIECRGKVCDSYTEWSDVAGPRDLGGSTKQRVSNVKRCLGFT